MSRSSHIPIQDWWIIDFTNSNIRVTEVEARSVLKHESMRGWHSVTDVFGSECHIRLEHVQSVFHINDAMIVAAREHHARLEAL